MEFEWWWTAVIIPVVVTLWEFLRKSIWPTFRDWWITESEADRQLEQRRQETSLTAEVTSLQTITGMTRQLVSDLIDSKNAALAEIKNTLNAVVQDKTRVDDIISDLERAFDNNIDTFMQIQSRINFIQITLERLEDLFTLANQHVSYLVDQERLREQRRDDR